jgi:hypothetical protein
VVNSTARPQRSHLAKAYVKHGWSRERRTPDFTEGQRRRRAICDESRVMVGKEEASSKEQDWRGGDVRVGGTATAIRADGTFTRGDSRRIVAATWHERRRRG